MTRDTKYSLYCCINVELFAAMKQILFRWTMQEDLQQLFQGEVERNLLLTINSEPWIEPDRPEWFDDCKFRHREGFSRT